MSLEERVLQLENENNALREELETTKFHLRKYTAPASSRNHYTKNKTAILEKKKNNPTTSEMRKIYNRRSYLKRKEKENENTTLCWKFNLCFQTGEGSPFVVTVSTYLNVYPHEYGFPFPFSLSA